MWKVSDETVYILEVTLTRWIQTRCFAFHFILDFDETVWNTARSLLCEMELNGYNDPRAARW